MGIVILTVMVPPVPETVARKFAGFLTGVQIDVADVLFEVIKTVRNDNTLRKTGEVVVIGEYLFQSIQVAIALEVAQIFLFLGIHTHDRVPASLIFSNQSSNVLKLLITMRHIFHRLFFELFFLLALPSLF